MAPMISLLRFLRRLDATAMRTVLVSLALFGTVIAIFVVGKTGSLLDVDGMSAALGDLAAGPWGLPALIVVFCLCAFLGVPQFVLIGMSVFAFGPMLGFAYAWLATLVSGTVTFWVGRLSGEDAMRRYGGNFANRMSAFIGRNAFAASAIVRNVPTGPFLMVNMAFGVSRARFSHYLAGMALGVLPKIGLVAFAGSSIASAVDGNLWMAGAAAALAVGIWIGLALYARSRVRGERKTVSHEAPETVDSDGNRYK